MSFHQQRKEQAAKLAKAMIESHGLDNDKKLPDFTNWMLIGREMSKIQYWTHQYEFSFQFWGEHQNNVFINRDDVEVASFGGEETPYDIIKLTVEWCEKSNPRKKYPDGIEVSNPQP